MSRVQKSAGFDCDSLTDFDENVKNSSEIGGEPGGEENEALTVPAIGILQQILSK